MTRRSVVLPAPLGPRMSVSPAVISSERPRMMGRSSKMTVTSRSDASPCTVRMMRLAGGLCPPAPAVALSLVAVFLLACAAEPPATAPAARGRQVYQALRCSSCHEPNLFGQRVGPPLDHIGTIAATRRPGLRAQAYLRGSGRDPAPHA